MAANPNRVSTTAGQVTISRQLLDDHAAISEAYERAIIFDLTATPAEKAAKAAERRARLEAEWDAHPGMVGLEDHSDYGCDPEYRLAERGEYVSLWTTPEKWQAYQEARDRFEEAADAL